MKNLPYLLLLSLSFFLSPLLSQELGIEITKKEIFINPHQIGLSIGTNKDISMAYRRHLRKSSFLRSNLNAKPEAAYIDATLRAFRLAIGLSIGMETHIPISNKFNLYYGGEAKFSTTIYGYTINRNIINFSGLTGIKFKMNEQVALFTETKFGLDTFISFNSQGVLSQVRPAREINIGLLYRLV
jgi:hypothetical protein